MDRTRHVRIKLDLVIELPEPVDSIPDYIRPEALPIALMEGAGLWGPDAKNVLLGGGKFSIAMCRAPRGKRA